MKSDSEAQANQDDIEGVIKKGKLPELYQKGQRKTLRIRTIIWALASAGVIILLLCILGYYSPDKFEKSQFLATLFQVTFTIAASVITYTLGVLSGSRLED